MANMSYCRFQNTWLDLRDCYDSIDDILSADEQKARLKIIKLCVEIAEDYGYEAGADVTVSWP